MAESENKRTRRTPQERAAEVDEKIAKIDQSIKELESKKESVVAEYDAKITAARERIKSLEAKKQEILAPKPPRKPRKSKQQKIQEIMDTLRKNTPAEIGGYQVLKARDYQADTIKDMATGEVTGTGLPASNVLYYDLSDGAWVCVRPSGTEPKVKFYYGIKGNSLADAEEKSAKLGEEVVSMINALL